jgi:AbrB family looped-hinge helix DNA binding protein
MDTADGKFASTVRVGEKGQIVIPKQAREMFNIKPGDTLLLLADDKRGIAIVRHELFTQFTNSILQTIENPVEPED